jgi:uncharacterized protein (TIGR02466 family)
MARHVTVRGLEMGNFRDVYNVKIYEKMAAVDLAELRELCLEKDREFRSRNHVRLSQAWDKYNVFDWQHPEVAKLASEILTATKEYLDTVPMNQKPKGFWLDGWVNIARNYEYHAEHIHPNSVISAILYVQVPDFDPDDSNFGAEPFGATCFSLERWTCGNPLWSNEIWLEPVAGKLVLIPSNLPHYVAPNKSDTPRITISSNINAG